MGRNPEMSGIEFTLDQACKTAGRIHRLVFSLWRDLRKRRTNARHAKETKGRSTARMRNAPGSGNFPGRTNNMDEWIGRSVGKSNSNTPRVATEVGPWAQIPVWVLEHDLSAAELKVYIALRSYSHARLGSGDDQGVFPHVDTIAKRANIHLRTAEKAISRLRERGLIASTRRYNDQGWIRGCDYMLADLPVAPSPKGKAVDEPHSEPVEQPNRPNGRGHTGETAGEVTGQTTGAVTNQGELTTELDNGSPTGTSSRGPNASRSDAKSKPKKPVEVLRGRDLVGLTAKEITQKLTAVWHSVLKQHGGEAPVSYGGGWRETRDY